MGEASELDVAKALAAGSFNGRGAGVENYSCALFTLPKASPLPARGRSLAQTAAAEAASVSSYVLMRSRL